MLPARAFAGCETTGYPCRLAAIPNAFLNQSGFGGAPTIGESTDNEGSIGQVGGVGTPEQLWCRGSSE